MTISEVVSKLGVSMTSERAASNPNMIDPSPGSFHWLCTLTCNGRTMLVPFTQGAAHVRWYTGTPHQLGSLSVAPRDIREKYAPHKGAFEKESADLHNYRKNCTEPTPPEMDSVLGCLALDASGYDNSRDFEDWCSEYGYDTDSRRAEKCYRDCGELAKKLRHLLGEDGYRELLEAERL